MLLMSFNNFVAKDDQLKQEPSALLTEGGERVRMFIVMMQLNILESRVDFIMRCVIHDHEMCDTCIVI